MESFKLLSYEEQQLVLITLNSHSCLPNRLMRIVRSLFSDGFDLMELRQISADARKPKIVTSLDVASQYDISVAQAYILSYLHNSKIFRGRLTRYKFDIELVYCADYKLSDLAVIANKDVKWQEDNHIGQVSVGSLGAVDCTESTLLQMCFPTYGDTNSKPIVIGRIYPKIDGIPIGLITFNDLHYGMYIVNPSEGIRLIELDDDCGHRLEYDPRTDIYYARTYYGSIPNIVKVPSFDFKFINHAYKTGIYDGIPCDGLILVSAYMEFRLKFYHTYDLKFSGSWSPSVIIPKTIPEHYGIYEVNSSGDIVRRRYDKIAASGLAYDMVIQASANIDHLDYRIFNEFEPNFDNDQDLSIFSYTNPTLDNVTNYDFKYMDPLLIQSYLYYNGYHVTRDKIVY